VVWCGVAWSGVAVWAMLGTAGSVWLAGWLVLESSASRTGPAKNVTPSVQTHVRGMLLDSEKISSDLLEASLPFGIDIHPLCSHFVERITIFSCPSPKRKSAL
jgi:hypothetical protein